MISPRFCFPTAILCLLLQLSIIAHSAPILGPSGNAYEFIGAGGVTWEDAHTAAMELSYAGAMGHLVAVDDDLENDFVLSLLGGVDGSVWLGGSDAAVEGAWKWVTGQQFWQGDQNSSGGPDVAYSNWIPGIEPNDCCNGEDFLTMFGPLVRGQGYSAPGLWNDLSAQTMSAAAGDDFYIFGYVVEYEMDIPTPASIAMFAIGLMGIGCARRAK